MTRSFRRISTSAVAALLAAATVHPAGAAESRRGLAIDDYYRIQSISEPAMSADGERKVATVEPRGKVILDTCGGLGYFAAWCMQAHAARILSYEKSADVLWLRGLNPWSPAAGGALSLAQGDIVESITAIPDRSVEAILHDPPRFGIAGELYSAAFYEQLARVLARGGRLFHYTGTPNKVSRGRNLPLEVATRLRRAGFSTEPDPDGVRARLR